MAALYQDTSGLLQRLNPLTKVIATAPPLLLLTVTRDPYVPGALLTLTTVVIVSMGRIPVARLVQIGAGLSVLIGGFLVMYPLAASAETVRGTPVIVTIGPIDVHQGGVMLGLSTGLRIAAMLSLTLFFALTTDGADFIRALVQRWGVPYRLGYTALAAFRFVPRFRHELDLIASAHRIRGQSDHGGVRARWQRARRYTVPLLSSGIRHSERVALVMDARGFGAYADRTFLRQLNFHRRDVVFVTAFWTVSAGLVGAIAMAGYMAPLSMLG